MISNAFLFIIDGVLSILVYPIGLLPDATLPADFTTGLQSLAQYYSALNGVFPIDTILSILAIIFTVEGFIFTFKMFQWIIKKIPGIS